MANAFGRAGPGFRGSRPPLRPTKHPFDAQNHDKIDDGTTLMIQHERKKKLCSQRQSIVCTTTIRKKEKNFSQSETTFVEVSDEKSNTVTMVNSRTQAATHIVSPEKANQAPKLVTLEKGKRKSSFLNSKRKKSESDEKWSRDRIIQELTHLMSEEDLHTFNVEDSTELELRKQLYTVLSSAKKPKNDNNDTMDVGQLLMDSTMEYVPRLSDESTDEEIESLEKHDAILELADFIRKCGKRVNFHSLNSSSVEDLHKNIKIARDDHKRVKLVFPELKGSAASWFGPRGDRTDHDYEPSEQSDDPLDDWDEWDEQLSESEIKDLQEENADKASSNDDNKKQDPDQTDVSLTDEHQKLLQELYTQVENKEMPDIKNRVDTSVWSKEKLSEEILKIGQKVGQTHYHTVLMNSSKEYLRKQFHSLLMTFKEKKNKNQTKNNLYVQKTQNKNKKSNKNVCQKVESDVGSDGEFEWKEEDRDMETPKVTVDGQYGMKQDTEKDKSSAHDKAESPVNSTKTVPLEQNESDNKKTRDPNIQLQNEDTNPKNNSFVFNRGTTDESLKKLNRFELITILTKRIEQNGKVPDDYLVEEDTKNLLVLVMNLRDLIGLSDIQCEPEDVKKTRLRIVKWKKDQFHIKNTEKNNSHTHAIPGSFDKTFTLPETENVPEVQKEVPQDEVKHTTFASVERAEQIRDTPNKGSEVQFDGVDISQFTPKSNKPQSINEPPEEPNTEEHKVVSFTQKTFHMRISYGLQKRGHHTPSEIKNFIKILRSVDPQIKLLPFTVENNGRDQDMDVITDENQLPDNQTALLRWVVGIETSYNNKLHFSLRASSTKTFLELRYQLFDWCTRSKSYIKFDNITSTKVFGAGWLLGIHPLYHNRNSIKGALCRDNIKLMEKISIYPRKVWSDSSEEKEKTKTNAIVIDGCFHHKDEILRHLCSYKWEGPYKNVTFVPFKVNEVLTKRHQQKAMQEQNVFLRDTWSKILNVKGSINLLECQKTQKKFTFLQWLKLCEIHGKRLLQGVEYISNEKVRIIYNKDKEYDVCNMLTYLFPAIEDQFGKVVAESLLGDKTAQMNLITTKNIEHTYSTNCAQTIMQRSNPQEEEINQPPKVKFNSYYGASKKAIDENKPRSQPRTYSEVSKGSTSRIDPELQSTINQLQETQREQSQTIVTLNDKLNNVNKMNQKENSQNESNDPTEQNDIDETERRNLREEIEELKKSQDERYNTLKQEIDTTIDEKIQESKNEILQVVEENKDNISGEIERLRTSQEEATKSLREQQADNKDSILKAIEVLAARIDSNSNTPPPNDPPINPPISPVEHGSRHGGGS